MGTTTATTITTGKESATSLPRFTATLRSEAAKLWTLSFPRALWLLAVLAAPACGALLLLTAGITQGEPLANLAPVDVAGTGLLGVDVTAIILTVLGAWTVADEFATGMIRTTLVATPKRSAIFSAKILITAAVTALGGLLAAVGSLAATQLILAGQGIPLLDLAAPELLRLASGSAGMVPFYAVLAAASAFLIRNTGGAVTCTLAVMFVPALIGMMPEPWQHLLLPLLPSSALHSISGSAGPTEPEYLVPGLGLCVLTFWLALVLSGAITAFTRRDV